MAENNRPDIIDPNSPEGLAEARLWTDLNTVLVTLARTSELTAKQKTDIANRVIGRVQQNIPGFFDQGVFKENEQKS